MIRAAKLKIARALKLPDGEMPLYIPASYVLAQEQRRIWEAREAMELAEDNAMRYPGGVPKP